MKQDIQVGTKHVNVNLDQIQVFVTEKQRCNEDKCRWECKELVDKGICDKGLICNPSNCECECDKFCDVGEYLYYENCKCRKKLIDKLVEECTENIKGVKLAKITLAENENKYKCSSCTLYIVLFSILFTINVGTGTYFVCSHQYLEKDDTRIKFGTHTQTIETYKRDMSKKQT